MTCLSQPSLPSAFLSLAILSHRLLWLIPFLNSASYLSSLSGNSASSKFSASGEAEVSWVATTAGAPVLPNTRDGSVAMTLQRQACISARRLQRGSRVE